jgi:hypothetical protein
MLARFLCPMLIEEARAKNHNANDMSCLVMYTS